MGARTLADETIDRATRDRLELELTRTVWHVISGSPSVAEEHSRHLDDHHVQPLWRFP